MPVIPLPITPAAPPQAPRPSWLADMLAADVAELLEVLARLTQRPSEPNGDVVVSGDDLAVILARCDATGRRLIAWTSTS